MTQDAAPSDGTRLPYLPSLDGLRGLAVAAVLLFHADVPGLPGGHLGVSAFFTLSGFLITALLLLERERDGRVALRAFWGRRARRLVPAMLLCFGLVAAVVRLSPTPPGSGLVGDAVASAGWVANWRFILEERSYGDLFALPSPFQHFWSLAVEEQFYVVFPLLLLLVLGRGGGPLRRGRLAVVLGVLVAASTVQAARLYDPAGDTARAYFGTDARAAELLVGALLAVALVGPAGLRTLRAEHRAAVLNAGGLGLAGLALAVATLPEESAVLYRGGFLAIALCTAAVIAAAVQPWSGMSRVLAFRPLVSLGVISYGAYLYHWPVFLLLTEEVTGLPPLELLAARLGVTLLLATVSYWLVELPIRYGLLSPPAQVAGWATGAVAGVAAIALAAGTVTVPGGTDDDTTDVVAVAPGDALGEAPTLTGQAAAPAAPTDPAAGAAGAATAAARPAQPAAPQRQAAAPAQAKAAPAARKPGRKAAAPAQFFADPKKSQVPPPPAAREGALRIAVVGDSIGQNLGRGLHLWAAERDDVVVHNLSIPACPLSRGGIRRFGDERPFEVAPECSWWDDADSERRRSFEQFSPHLVVVHDAVNEIVDRRLPDWEEYRAPGHPRFDPWLRDEYAAAFTRWRAAGAGIVVANAACADWDRYERFSEIEDVRLRVQAINLNVYAGMVGVRVADLFERLCPGGRYSDTVEGVPDGRPDGFHLSDAAALALARNWLGPIVLQAAAQRGAEPLPVGGGVG